MGIPLTAGARDSLLARLGASQTTIEARESSFQRTRSSMPRATNRVLASVRTMLGDGRKVRVCGLSLEDVSEAIGQNV